MATISKTKDRSLAIQKEGDCFLIEESEVFIPYGYNKRKWDRRCIGLTIEELRKALSIAESTA